MFSGVHRIQEVSGKKRHTSIVTVSVSSGEFVHNELDLMDVSFQEYRSSGAGGQHRNKVATAIRATHKPTGKSVTAEDSKSQHINKQNAVKKLEKLLNDDAQKQFSVDVNHERVSQIGRGSRPEHTWNWNGWRDSVSIPEHGSYSMSKTLKGKFPF